MAKKLHVSKQFLKSPSHSACQVLMYGALKTLRESFRTVSTDARVMSLSCSPETESVGCHDIICERKKLDRRKRESS